jgi:hypothetical protein
MSILTRRVIYRHHPGARGDPSLVGGRNFTRLGNETKWFETDYFKYGAAPQYLLRYSLKSNSPKWSCTCPDFVYRRAQHDLMCKHCEGAALLVRNPSEFVLRHVREIDQETYNFILATPLGQPLPLFGHVVRVRVNVPAAEPGFISYTHNRWHCYTCGGPNGSIYLKGKQCKHIACYIHSLTDDNYQQYSIQMEYGAFRGARNRQRRDVLTHWQRFT